MTFNEMFFFIFGVVLIFLGYRAKIRIDMIIPFLIIINLVLKIAIYYALLENKDVYTTLYYYLFDYGKIILNPLFNLNYFLIGMYFGLINYSLQKGIALNIRDFFNVKNNGEKEHLLDKNDVNQNDSLSITDKGIERIYLHRKSKNKNTNKELKLMPFLKSTIKIIEWHKEKKEAPKKEKEKEKNEKGQKKKIGCFFSILLIILFLIIIFFSFINMIFINYIEKTTDKKEKYETFLLEDFLANPTLNFIFLFDIEIFVLFIQWAFFIFYMKGQFFFIDFFSNYHWSFLTKSYFSFLLICNPIILFIFYESETFIKLNLHNILLYYFINLAFIITFTILFYIGIDLPLKKIFKYLIKGALSINIPKNYSDDEENVENKEKEENNDEDEKNEIDII
jgi:hypothetical protein